MYFGKYPLIKYLEFVMAAYALAVGLLFVFNPGSLDAAVYRPWLALGPLTWGLSLIVVAAAHFGALWLNGRAALLSRSVRVCVNFVHLYISFRFAAFFYEGGAPWGIFTFGLLVPGLILPILATTYEEAKAAAYGG